MFMGVYEFEGDPVELLAAYDRLMSGMPADGLSFHACVERPSGIAIYDCCPTAEVFAAFSSSAGMLEAIRAAGLPIPVVTPLGDVHVARTHDVFVTEQASAESTRAALRSYVRVIAESIRFHLDPRCPWCWQTSKWVRRLAQLDVVEPSWAVFCLEIANFPKPFEQFDVDRCVAAPALRTMVAVRDAEGQAAAGAFYEAVGNRYFHDEQPLADAATVEGALADAGLDPTWCERATKDPATWDAVVDEHRALVADTRSFGVPTIRLDGGTGPAIFGPVISNPPVDDDEAVELWGHVSWLIRNENFSELKRDRTIDPDLAYWRTAVAARRS